MTFYINNRDIHTYKQLFFQHLNNLIYTGMFITELRNKPNYEVIIMSLLDTILANNNSKFDKDDRALRWLIFNSRVDYWKKKNKKWKLRQIKQSMKKQNVWKRLLWLNVFWTMLLLVCMTLPRASWWRRPRRGSPLR